MIPADSLPAQNLHLRAARNALLAAFVVLMAGVLLGKVLERRYIHVLALDPFPLKNQGVALQREAAAQPDLLPIYGSSELVKAIPDRANLFFRKYPTDFNAFPIGKAGTTSLVILQKLAAVGPALRGKKIAISVSPSWFFVEQLSPHYYDGNFSPLHAGELIFNPSLSTALKGDAARRMLEFPLTVEGRPLIDFALHRLVAGTRTDHALLALATPLGHLENAILQAQDHIETAAYILLHVHTKPHPRRHPLDLDWDMLFAQAARRAALSEKSAEGPEDPLFPATEAEFLETLDRAHEWIDLDLLLRGVRELGAEPLLMSMPINGGYFDHAGISSAARRAYYSKIRTLAKRRHVPLVDFENHDEDNAFLLGHHDHLSEKGWIYYDKALDDFFHGRMPKID